MTITYNGTTAGSTSQNPPSLLCGVVGGQVTNSPGLFGGKLHFYTSTNVATDLNATTYAISDADALGWDAGDVVIGVQATAGSTTPFLYIGVVAKVTAGAGACLSSSILTSTAA